VSTTVVREKAKAAKEMASRYEALLRLRQQIRESDQKINELLNEFESYMEKGIEEYVDRKKGAGAQ
jgi:cell division protein ZapA (FtsZ GTPase activity inhibitor)